MNILLWVLQTLLAVHTAIGAAWKFSQSPAATMPSLAVIPNGIWQAMSMFELVCSLLLLLPAINKRLGILTPLAALSIAVEMLVFCGLHLAAGAPDYGPMIYWLVAAAVCVFIAYGRYKLKPIKI